MSEVRWCPGRSLTGPRGVLNRLSVAQYHAMARKGILEEDAPVELLEGWLVRNRQIEVYTEPASGAKRAEYRQRRDYKPGDVVPVVIEGAEIGQVAVRELLP